MAASEVVKTSVCFESNIFLIFGFQRDLVISAFYVDYAKNTKSSNLVKSSIFGAGNASGSVEQLLHDDNVNPPLELVVFNHVLFQQASAFFINKRMSSFFFNPHSYSLIYIS